MALGFLKRRRRADISPLTFDEWQSYFTAPGGLMYPIVNQTLAGNKEEIALGFPGFSQGALKGSGVVFACIYARMAVFSQARFKFQTRTSTGRPGPIFGTDALRPLEHPWVNGVTADLLSKAEMDVSLAGNFFLALRRDGSFRRLRPDWVDILIGSDSDPEVAAYDLDAEVLAYAYWPGGRGMSDEPVYLEPERVAHYAPISDPEAEFRGMSWLTPVIREILADKATTSHKLKFFEQGATPNLKVKFEDVTDPDKFQKWVDKFRDTHEGVRNSFRTLFLAAGSDAEVIGSNLNEIDFTKVQGGGELRIASAAGVPASIVGLAKSLEGSALNNDAKDSARRRFADVTMQHLWDSFAASIAHLVEEPPGADLVCDRRFIPFLKDDLKDLAAAFEQDMAAISSGVTSGYTPDSVRDAVVAHDASLLHHSGLVSVQLLPPGTDLGGNDASGGPSAQTFVGRIENGQVVVRLGAELQSLAEPFQLALDVGDEPIAELTASIDD